MKVTRKIEIDTDSFEIGDQIKVSHYTATCQKVSGKSALFFMDQYDDNPQQMNNEDANECSYEKSDMRRQINSEESLKDFPENIRSRMVQFENGDLIRIPTVCELFGHEECKDWCEDDGAEQLPLMVSSENRIAYRRNEYEWGWLQNKITAFSALYFATVTDCGHTGYSGPSYVCGVRRVFQISNGGK